jgi:hypothetical protein
MRQKQKLHVTVVAFGIIFSVSVAPSQETPVSLQDQLKAQYQLAKVLGNQIAEGGTYLAVQKAGILGAPQLSLAMCPSKYQDGELHLPGRLCAAMFKESSYWFKAGEKVFPTKISVNLKKDEVIVAIVAPETLFKSEVIFQFAKGSLDKPDVLNIEDTIGQVLAVDHAPAPEAAASNNPPQPEAPQKAQPAHVTLGQSPDEVQAILGALDRLADLGPKPIYIYKDL